jgi:hypothetical protein
MVGVRQTRWFTRSDAMSGRAGVGSVRRCGSEYVGSLGVGAFVGSAEGWPGTLRQKPGFAPGNLLYAFVAPIPVLDCGQT